MNFTIDYKKLGKPTHNCIHSQTWIFMSAIPLSLGKDASHACQRWRFASLMTRFWITSVPCLSRLSSSPQFRGQFELFRQNSSNSCTPQLIKIYTLYMWYKTPFIERTGPKFLQGWPQGMLPWQPVGFFHPPLTPAMLQLTLSFLLFQLLLTLTFEVDNVRWPLQVRSLAA